MTVPDHHGGERPPAQPCPWCGPGTVIFPVSGPCVVRWSVECGGCGARGPEDCQTEKQALLAWNGGIWRATHARDRQQRAAALEEMADSEAALFVTYLEIADSYPDNKTRGYAEAMRAAGEIEGVVRRLRARAAAARERSGADA